MSSARPVPHVADVDSAYIDGFVTVYELVDGEYKMTGSRLVSQLAG
ncbi:hypothetical protein [Nocardia rhizosphaerae]|uniref:Uncharacterized protein n=1 Tax=Nocardia rhizosphaerae TaxID=1691571 RepID=A0ABV8L2A9_9NOCA